MQPRVTRFYTRCCRPVPVNALPFDGRGGEEPAIVRADRLVRPVAPEALAVVADPLHLTAAFGLNLQTAIDYSEIARNLLERPIEATTRPPHKNS